MAKGSVAGISDEDLERAGLSEAERLALEEEPTDVESLRDLVEGEDAGEGEFDDDEPGQFVPRYIAPPVEHYDEQVAALETRRAEALEKFKAADIELDDLLAEQSRIDGERRKLDEARLKHDISVESEQQATSQEWRRDIEAFFARVKRAEGIDYRGNKSMNAALDQAVKDLGNARDKNGNYVNDGKSGAWFLKEAHKQVMQGIGRGASRGGEAGDVDVEDREERMDRADFDRLDDLTGLDLEAAVAEMSPEEQDRWARSN